MSMVEESGRVTVLVNQEKQGSAAAADNPQVSLACPTKAWFPHRSAVGLGGLLPSEQGLRGWALSIFPVHHLNVRPTQLPGSRESWSHALALKCFGMELT